MKLLLHGLPHGQCVLPQRLRRLVSRLFVAHIVPQVAVLRVLHQEPPGRVEVPDLIDDAGRDQALLAFEPRREVNALLAVHEVAVLLIAWVGIDGAAAAAENVVLVGGGGVGSG